MNTGKYLLEINDKRIRRGIERANVDGSDAKSLPETPELLSI